MRCYKCHDRLRPEATDGDDVSGFAVIYYEGELIAEHAIVSKAMKLTCDSCGAEYARDESGDWELTFDGSGDLVAMMEQAARNPYAFVAEEDGNPLSRVMDVPEDFLAIPAEEPDEEDEE